MMGATIGIATAIVGALTWAYKLGQKRATTDFTNVAQENKYKLVYAPLRKVLIDKHITSARSVLFPTFGRRWKRARPYLWAFELKEFCKKINDKYGNERTAEIEFGGSFPLPEMREILDANIMWADHELINHIQWAERSKYEERHEDKSPYAEWLTREELELADYIYDTFDNLNKKLIK